MSSAAVQSTRRGAGEQRATQRTHTTTLTLMRDGKICRHASSSSWLSTMGHKSSFCFAGCRGSTAEVVDDATNKHAGRVIGREPCTVVAHHGNPATLVAESVALRQHKFQLGIFVRSRKARLLEECGRRCDAPLKRVKATRSSKGSLASART